MKFQIKSLAFQIWLSFVVLSLILLVWLLLFLKTEKKSEKLSIFSFELANVHNNFSENIINYQKFLLTGYKDESFYTQNAQKDIDDYLSNLKDIQLKLQILEQNAEVFNLKTHNEFEAIIAKNEHLLKLADSLKSVIKFRGFKDYGLEGRMRTYAHALEDSTQIKKAEILQLRRHEKDFFLRGDRQYLLRFNNLATGVKDNFDDHPRIQNLLKNYAATFNRYVELSENLGFYNEAGLLGDIKQMHQQINLLFLNMKNKSSNRIISLNNKHSNYLIIQTIFIAVIAILVSMFLAKTLTYDVKLLNKNFRYYIQSDFLKNPDLEIEKPDFKLSSIEIRKLFANFQLLKETLSKTINKLNDEVDKSEKAASYKARFLANMSHEIRTPLNGIVGMLQLIQTEDLSCRQQEHISIAEYSTNHLLDLVNMILDYSKLEVGKMRIDKHPIDLRLILKNLEGIFQYQALEKNLQLQVNCEYKVPHKVLGDSMRLQQILMNLLSNALKFTDEGRVILNVFKTVETSTHIGLAFEVIDTGIGIQKEDQAKLFEAFEQKDLSTTRQHGGTGLGLTITNQLIDLMGSKLYLESDSQKGSRFYFEVNLEKISSESNIANRLGSLQEKPHSLQDYRVMVVEDNKINQLVIDKMLRKLGINSLIVENGEKAFDLFLIQDFDLILMDIHMPKMNGLEATRLIKSHPKYLLHKPPIIAITASAFDEDRDEALAKGMDDFITKPIIFKSLEQVINKYLSLQNS